MKLKVGLWSVVQGACSEAAGQSSRVQAAPNPVRVSRFSPLLLLCPSRRLPIINLHPHMII